MEAELEELQEVRDGTFAYSLVLEDMRKEDDKKAAAVLERNVRPLLAPGSGQDCPLREGAVRISGFIPVTVAPSHIARAEG